MPTADNRLLDARRQPRPLVARARAITTSRGISASQPLRAVEHRTAEHSTTERSTTEHSPVALPIAVPCQLAKQDFAFRSAVLPELVITDTATAIAVAETVLNAGLSSLLVSCLSTAAWESVMLLSTALPALQLGATVSRAELAQPHTACADFLCYQPNARLSAVSATHASVTTLPLLNHAREIPFYRDSGQPLLTIAPADLHAGLLLLKALSVQAPALRVCVTGSIARQDMPLYLAKSNVAAVCAPWIIAPELLRRRDWQGIQRQARAAAALRMM